MTSLNHWGKTHIYFKGCPSPTPELYCWLHHLLRVDLKQASLEIFCCSNVNQISHSLVIIISNKIGYSQHNKEERKVDATLQKWLEIGYFFYFLVNF